MSALDDLLANPAPKRGGQPQVVPKILAAMPPELRAKAEAALDGESSMEQVAEAFRAEGYDVSGSTINLHRKRHRLGPHRPKS